MTERITFVDGDIFLTDAPFVMHQVNAQGVMGAGIAKKVKEDISEKDFLIYKKGCELGKVIVAFSISHPKRKYLNVVGQKYYGRNPNVVYTDYDALKKGLGWISKNLEPNTKIAIPYKMGAGLANGDWNIIFNLIKTYLKNFYIFIYRFEK